MKSLRSLKSFFLKILGALFDWQHAEKTLCVNADGQPLAIPPPRQNGAVDHLESVFLCVNNGAPFRVPPSRLEGVIKYLELVVLGQRTHKVLALTAGQMRVASEIKSAQELMVYLKQGYIINMDSY